MAQAPSLTNQEARRAAAPSRWDAVGRFLSNDRIERFQTGKVNYIKVVSSEAEPCALPGIEAFNAFMALEEKAPRWRNAITVESLEKFREFDAVTHIGMMSPAALLVIAAESDSLIPVDTVMNNYERAPEPKKFVVHDIGHFDIYQEPWLSVAANEAAAWFRTHLEWEDGPQKEPDIGGPPTPLKLGASASSRLTCWDGDKSPCTPNRMNSFIQAGTGTG